MVTDARGHEVPADSDMWGYREDMGDLSASIADVRPVPDQAAAEAAVADLAASDIDPAGTVWWLANPGALYVYTGTEWHSLVLDTRVANLAGAMQTGQATVTAVPAGGIKNMTVTLAVGRFSKAPLITVSPFGANSPKAFMCSTSTVSAAAFQLKTGSLVDDQRDGIFSWHAIQDGSVSRLAQPEAFRAGAEEATDSTITCTTPGCGNEGIPIPVTTSWTDDEGHSYPIDGYMCGVCGADITDTLQPIDGS